MFAPFFIFTCWIVAIGPGHIEGGFKAIDDKGLKPALEQAWKERESYDSSSLKGKLGNYGND